MEKQWLITFRSVTFAQKGQHILQTAGILCQLQRTPKELSRRGCGYCLRMSEKIAFYAVERFRQEQLPFEKVYALQANGQPEERQL